jgi:acyl-CoA reductase-like NAD-dependent aldehyde dehydrogenase
MKNLEKALKLANSPRNSLSMAIFRKGIDVAMSVADCLECGIAWVNAGACASEIGFPFGGRKDSGIGTTEWAEAALDTLSRRRTTYINYSGERRLVCGYT